MGFREMKRQGEFRQEAGCRKEGYEENGNRYVGIKESGYRRVGFEAAIYGGCRIGEAKDNMGRCLKNDKKKWVKAGGMLLAVLLTACSGEENDESNTAMPSAIELDNIMSKIPEASNGDDALQGEDGKDFQTQHSDQQEAGDHSSRQPGDASNPDAAIQAAGGLASDADWDIVLI